jgi:hypothetical protein
MFVFNEICVQHKLYILAGTLLGPNMKLALLYDLTFTKVYVNLEKYVISSAEPYLKSVYLNLLVWRGA